MNTSEIKVGTEVVKSGYAGTVVEVCSWDTNMIVVRLNSGTTCVSRETFSGQYENNYITKI